MKKIITWGIFTVVLAGALHLLAMSAIPHFVTNRLLSTVFNSSENWQIEKVNRLFHAAIRMAGTDKVPLDNPDTMTSFGFYDVSENPVRIHCVVPSAGNYWSLSLYGWNTDNYFVINDKQVNGQTVDVVVKGKNQTYNPLPGEIVVDSPGSRGVVLARIIVRDRSNSGELTAVAVTQKMAYMQEVK